MDSTLFSAQISVIFWCHLSEKIPGFLVVEDGRQRAPGEIFVPCARVCPCTRQAESYAGGLSRYFVNGCKTDGSLEPVLL